VVEALAAPLARVLGAEVGHRIADLHRGHGVEVLTATSAGAIRRVDHTHVEVQMADGRACCADAVLVGARDGVAMTWLASSGIEHEGAVIVDDVCGTSAPDVLAAGDCTRWFHPAMANLCTSSIGAPPAVMAPRRHALHSVKASRLRRFHSSGRSSTESGISGSDNPQDGTAWRSRTKIRPTRSWHATGATSGSSVPSLRAGYTSSPRHARSSKPRRKYWYECPRTVHWEATAS
jgi:hypothetical protein